VVSKIGDTGEWIDQELLPRQFGAFEVGSENGAPFGVHEKK